MTGDLHTHTRLSDGSMSIDDLIFYAKRSGLDFIAITDHDTMDGVTRASVLGKRHGVSVIPGVEISCYDYKRSRKVHILCYLPEKPDRLQGLFTQILERRTKSGKRVIHAVSRYYPVTDEHINRYTSGSRSIYRSHIMQAIIDLGYDVKIYGDVYNELFDSESGLCFREIEYPDVYDVLELIHSAGGIAVMAHPFSYNSVELLEELAAAELIHGAEVYHPDTPESKSVDVLVPLMEKYDLLQTGGSDFHGSYITKPRPLASRISTDDMINALFSKKSMLSKKGGAHSE